MEVDDAAGSYACAGAPTASEDTGPVDAAAGGAAATARAGARDNPACPASSRTSSRKARETKLEWQLRPGSGAIKPAATASAAAARTATLAAATALGSPTTATAAGGTADGTPTGAASAAVAAPAAAWYRQRRAACNSRLASSSGSGVYSAVPHSKGRVFTSVVLWFSTLTGDKVCLINATVGSQI